MADLKFNLLNMHLSKLNDQISRIESLTLTEQTKVEYDKLIQRIKLTKHLIENIDENSRENALATSALKRLGLNHPEMRPWISELVFKNGIEKEKVKINLKNKINTTYNNFKVIANNPNIDIKQYEDYQGMFEYLRNELIKNKDLFTSQEYNNLLQELNQSTMYINSSLEMYNEEKNIWKNDSFTL